MYKNLTWKIGIIGVLLFVFSWSLYPPSMTLKPGIDLAGGTSLIYAINTQGVAVKDRKGLSERMITVLRRRIDPANIQNLVWRPQGSSRFEIQMPLASAEARDKRQQYEAARSILLGTNVSQAIVLRSMESPLEEQQKQFDGFAAGDPNKLEILKDLATIHDERKALKGKRTEFEDLLKTQEDKIAESDLQLPLVKFKRGDWAKLGDEELSKSLREFTDANDNVEMLSGYVKTYAEWLDVIGKITDPEEGVNIRHARATKLIDQLNLSEDQLDRCLGFEPGSSKRATAVEELKAEFQDRVTQIDKVIAAHSNYLPFRGRLDDPKDLQRMLKGAGILEFRILPTSGHPETDSDLMASYIESLKEKGPRYASDENYVWCEAEAKPDKKWSAVDGQKRPSITGEFGDKTYVLASNKKNEVMLHSTAERTWKLEKATQGQDEYGGRAISFLLDDRGGDIFRKITSANIDRPLCILLDGIAISAPNIQTKIGRQGTITGSYTEEEQQDMINKLSAGSLPAMLIEQPLSVNTIGPSIGADNRDQGIRAGIIGLIAVIACMAIYYVLSGAIADVALLMNILFVLGIMAAVRATFTLPGIAGIILTIGMSVDANVLIFERIREEQQKGSSLRVAITNGYQRAFRTIFDANLTTFITAAILYWVASEEIKGFAIVLMLGIASSMFTALFVTRVLFDVLLSRRLIKDHLFMLRLIHKPNVNWMRLRPVFFSLSLILIIGGGLVFFTTSGKYDIEFTGGTSVQTNFKDSVRLTRQTVEDRITVVLPSANVYSVGEPIGQDPNGENIYKQYKIDTGATNTMTVAVGFSAAGHTTAELVDAIHKAENEPNFSATLSNLDVVQTDATDSSKFEVKTSQMNQILVKAMLTSAFPAATIGEPVIAETVNKAVLDTFADELEVQRNLQATLSPEEKISQSLIDSYPELGDFIGGIKVAFVLEIATTIIDLEQRLGSLQFKPDTQNLKRYPYRILGSDLNPIADPNSALKSFVYVSTPEDAGLRELSEEEWTQFVGNEKTKILSAAQLATSLPRVRQFDPSVGAEAKTQALIAIVLSLSAIITYIWVRFGNVRYGIAAIVALIHDVCITLGVVTACTYIASTSIGEFLMIDDFKINLAMIAAFLTLIGYSLNDTIVIFDRIRENRGKAKFINPQVITDSINQTISRTILTSFTTFIVVLIMYIFGGQGLRGFTFAIGFGIIVGTYSSIAIAAPILLLGAKTKSPKGSKGKPKK